MKISELQNILEHYKQENGPFEAKTLDDCKKMAIAFAKK